jgi:primary-amine oxidase
MLRGLISPASAPPREPYVRKCAFDVGDYGLGYCANSLSLGCDCLGHIHYFDAVLSNSKGEPYELQHAVCMHEEVSGLLRAGTVPGTTS